MILFHANIHGFEELFTSMSQEFFHFHHLHLPKKFHQLLIDSSLPWICGYTNSIRSIDKHRKVWSVQYLDQRVRLSNVNENLSKAAI